MLYRQKWFALCSAMTAGVLALVSGAPALAQSAPWPNKPVRIVVPFPAGGTTDVLARALGQELAKCLGQPVIVENKPGAGATLGADFVAKAKPAVIEQEQKRLADFTATLAKLREQLTRLA